VIEPDVKCYVWDDFSKSGDMIRAGEEAALKALPAIRNVLEGKKVHSDE